MKGLFWNSDDFGDLDKHHFVKKKYYSETLIGFFLLFLKWKDPVSPCIS
jgi:hypothetical protein